MNAGIADMEDLKIPEDLEVILAKAIAKTWLEPEFARKLTHCSKAALAEIGIFLEANAKIEICRGHEANWSAHRDGDRKIYRLTLAPCPVEFKAAIADEDLRKVAERPHPAQI